MISRAFLRSLCFIIEKPINVCSKVTKIKSQIAANNIQYLTVCITLCYKYIIIRDFEIVLLSDDRAIFIYISLCSMLNRFVFLANLTATTTTAQQRICIIHPIRLLLYVGEHLTASMFFYIFPHVCIESNETTIDIKQNNQQQPKCKVKRHFEKKHHKSLFVL